MTDTDLVRKPRAARVVAAAAGLTPLERTGVALVTAVVLFCVVTPFLPLYAPYAQDLSRAFVPPLTDAAHPLGTDMLGRDLASRLALGGLVSLGIVLLVVVVNAIIGMVVGLLAGYHGGRLDNVLMGWADVQLAMPVILVLIALSAAVGPSVWLMVVTLAATYWVGYARVARGTAMTLRAWPRPTSPCSTSATSARRRGPWSPRAPGSSRRAPTPWCSAAPASQGST
ncbi:ABC transporter permease [Promicromonospora sp. NPDC050262]|uniref:ABC transporter permease n=1 Tax=Promicromonospora sp. NPDC050262 TaxID=3155036 RepID=UPI0033C0DBB4